MESTGEPLRIQVSQTTADACMASGWACELRGEMQIKGKGLMQTYWLIGRQDETETN
jgi:hypothetical protein